MTKSAVRHRRQLVWFKRFYEDQQLKKASKDQLSSALFTLRSAMIIWKEHKGKGEAWQKNKLYLHCTLETDCWTAEGTEDFAVKKQKEINQVITRAKEKETLSPTQFAFIRRKQSTLAKLENSFPRPSKTIYQGKSNIYLGLALGLEQPATIAIVNVESHQAIAYRNIKQLLGENYHLIQKLRKEKQRLSHQRHKTGKKLSVKQRGESNLGEYLDRLIAKAILTVAQEYQVSTIIVPRLNNIREISEAEIQTRAEKRVPEYKEGQKKYAQDYRVQIHQWSYGRLIDSVKAIAHKLGITVEEGKQQKQGKFTEKALQLVLNHNLEKK